MNEHINFQTDKDEIYPLPQNVSRQQILMQFRIGNKIQIA